MSKIQTSYYRNKLRFDFSKEEVELLIDWISAGVRCEASYPDELNQRRALALQKVESKMQKFLNDMEEGK